MRFPLVNCSHSQVVQYAMIKIHTNSGKIYEGETFAIDPVTKSVALKMDISYMVINPEQITQIEGDITSLRSPPATELGIRY